MIVGMDFGTTNSGMAVYDGQQVQLLDLDPANRNPKVARTALYLANDQSIFIGREAIDRYFEHNLGRPVRMERVWVGEVEVTVSDMTWIQDVYVWIDTLSPGRLFLSVKTSLADADYVGTVVEPYFYALEDLIALYLYVTKTRAERLLGRELRQVVLGRPVRFSNDPEKDTLAQRRLIDAAHRAGYETVYLQYEPIAAALNYEQSIEREENVLIFDFGGGTLDLTVMRLGDPQRRSVLARGGVPIAGDIFDQKLIRARLPKHFGEGTIYGSRDKPLTVPAWIHNTFANWQTILQLQTPKNAQLLQNIARTARDPRGIKALVSLVSSNYGLRMFDVVEQAKRRLSRREGTMIPLSGPAFNIREPVARTEFEAIINQEFRIIEQNLDETVAASGLRPDQIDAVIRTGGSSQIPLFEGLLQQKFGPEKVRASNIFSSVTSGLGITAYRIQTGEIEAEAHRREASRRLKSGAARPQVNPVNLDLLKKRIAMASEAPAEVDHKPPSSLTLLTAAGEPRVVTLTGAKFEAGQSISLNGRCGQETLATLQKVLITRQDSLLVWVTSHYRFLLMTPGQLAQMQEGGVQVAAVHRFEEREQICTLDDWQLIREAPSLVLLTSQGIARPFQMEAMQARIESPVTPFQLDRPLSGLPVAVLGLNSEQEMIAVTAAGRAARARLDTLSVQGSQVISRRKEDRVIGAVVVNPDDSVLLLTQDGYARRVARDWLPEPAGKAQSTSLIARRPVQAVALAQPEAQTWLVTNTRLVPVDVTKIPPDEANSKKSYPLLKLDKGEVVQGILTR